MINLIEIKKAKNGWIVTVNPNRVNEMPAFDLEGMERLFNKVLPKQDELQDILDRAKEESEVKNATHVFIDNKQMIAFLDLLLNNEIGA